MKNKTILHGIIVVTVLIFSTALMSSCSSLGSIGATAGRNFASNIANSVSRDASNAIAGGISQSFSGQETEAAIRKKISTAVDNASPQIVRSLSSGMRIVVLGGSTSGGSYADYAIEDLEYNLVRAGFRLVDRREINLIRGEQNFQMSGEVDDNSAVSIGKMAGAQAVVVISINYSNKTGRLTLKGLNAQTSEIIAMVRQDI